MQSNLQSSSWAVLFFYWPAMLIATHWPRLDLGRSNVWWSNDKLMHFAAYALLATLLGLGMGVGVRGAGRRAWLSVVGIALLVAGYGVFDELTQPYFGRSADILDWSADLLGCAVGLLAAAAINLAVSAPPREFAAPAVACENDSSA